MAIPLMPFEYTLYHSIFSQPQSGEGPAIAQTIRALSATVRE